MGGGVFTPGRPSLFQACHPKINYREYMKETPRDSFASIQKCHASSSKVS